MAPYDRTSTPLESERQCIVPQRVCLLAVLAMGSTCLAPILYRRGHADDSTMASRMVGVQHVQLQGALAATVTTEAATTVLRPTLTTTSLASTIVQSSTSATTTRTTTTQIAETAPSTLAPSTVSPSTAAPSILAPSTAALSTIAPLSLRSRSVSPLAVPQTAFTSSTTPANPLSDLPVIPEDGSAAHPRIAVCAVGHLRTFPLPGVFSSFAEHITRESRGSADLYMVAHNGTFKPPHHKHTSKDYIDGPADPKLLQALAYLHGGELQGGQGFGVWSIPVKARPKKRAASTWCGLRLVHFEIHRNGDCAELVARWRATGLGPTTLPPPSKKTFCYEQSNFLQALWLDHCFRLTQRSEYDYLIRTRPDVALVAPIPWSLVSDSHVTVVPEAGRPCDWFFILPRRLLDKWWRAVPDFYIEVGRIFGLRALESKGLEFAIFQRAVEVAPHELAGYPEQLQERIRWLSGGVLPPGAETHEYFHRAMIGAAIVRSTDDVWCEIMPDSRTLKQCLEWVSRKGPTVLWNQSAET
eukprot:gnl/TRDRNA2_/TRDRNA2_81963_c0_seq1.p1 gnl/TRDRNA2_/TRDRNA2_81963_c0~~gnl/TRDRNA2_/TRDRNA2_81963_c0_seq1.p1  ORF type:complete len:527 (-),score=55.14 gnl/TRDRNA2_/TRDRNA2_81963_c0_seq1:606-2186(-)